MFVQVVVGTVFSIIAYITYNSFEVDYATLNSINIYMLLITFYFVGLIIERFSSSVFEHVLKKILPRKMKSHKEILKAEITSKRYEIHIRNYAMNRSFIVAFILLIIFTGFTGVILATKFKLIISYIVVIIVFLIHSAKLVNKINNYYE